jgi:hypothetical protein
VLKFIIKTIFYKKIFLEDKLPTYVVGYYEENPAVSEAITVTAETESGAFENARRKLKSELGINSYKIVSIKIQEVNLYKRDVYEEENHPKGNQNFNRKKTIVGYLKANSILAISLVVLMSSFLLVIYFRHQESAGLSQSADISDQISNLLDHKTFITNDMETTIKQLVNSTNFISEVRIYKGNGIPNHLQKPIYQYERRIWAPKLFYDIYPNGGGDGKWYVSVYTRYLGIFIYLFFFTCFVGYWTVFIIVSIINAVRKRNFNLSWFVLSVSLHMFVFLIFLLRRS